MKNGKYNYSWWYNKGEFIVRHSFNDQPAWFYIRHDETKELEWYDMEEDSYRKYNKPKYIEFDIEDKIYALEFNNEEHIIGLNNVHPDYYKELFLLKKKALL